MKIVGGAGIGALIGNITVSLVTYITFIVIFYFKINLEILFLLMVAQVVIIVLFSIAGAILLPRALKRKHSSG